MTFVIAFIKNICSIIAAPCSVSRLKRTLNYCLIKQNYKYIEFRVKVVKKKMSTRRQAIRLYRHLLREAEKIPAYNFRMYAIRKIRDTYRDNRTLSDHIQIDQQILFARESLELIRRQAIIGCLYSAEKLVIEKKPTLRPSDD